MRPLRLPYATVVVSAGASAAGPFQLAGLQISPLRRRQVVGVINGLLKPLTEAGVVVAIFTVDYVVGGTTPIFLAALPLVPLWGAAGRRTLRAYRTSAGGE